MQFPVTSGCKLFKKIICHWCTGGGQRRHAGLGRPSTARQLAVQVGTVDATPGEGGSRPCEEGTDVAGWVGDGREALGTRVDAKF